MKHANQRKRQHAVQPNLWGGESSITYTTKFVQPASTSAGDYRDCVLYGHTWQRAGMDGRRQCRVCRVYAYCPCCTPTFPPTAHLMCCSTHQAQQGGTA